MLHDARASGFRGTAEMEGYAALGSGEEFRACCQNAAQPRIIRSIASGLVECALFCASA